MSITTQYSQDQHIAAITMDDLGKIGELAVEDMLAATRQRDRKAAFTTLSKLVKLSGVILSDSAIVSISLGSDSNGKRLLVVNWISPHLKQPGVRYG